MNELEDRLTERLHGLAEFARTEPGTSAPDATLTELAPVRARRRPRTRLAAFGAAASVIVVAAVALSLTVWSAGSTERVRTAPSPLDGPSVPGEPTGPAVHQLTIQVSNFHFQADHFDVPPGITELHFVSLEGAHTLTFDHPELGYVNLAAPEGRASVKVDFVDGQTYALFDTLPGHRDAGEVATITVAP